MSGISDLFQKAPLDMTSADIDTIVEYFKQHRGNFSLVKPDGSIKRKRKTKAKVDPHQVDIEDVIKELTP